MDWTKDGTGATGWLKYEPGTVEPLPGAFADIHFEIVSLVLYKRTWRERVKEWWRRGVRL